jgi:hypothetical protein
MIPGFPNGSEQDWNNQDISMSVMGEPYQHRLEFLLNVVESLRIRTAFPMRPAFSLQKALAQ